MGSGNERVPGNELGALRAEQFPHLGNYTLTPEFICGNFILPFLFDSPLLRRQVLLRGEAKMEIMS